MDTLCCLHLVEDPGLLLRYWVQGIGNVLILLNVPDDFGSHLPLHEVDQLRILDHRGYSILNEDQIRQVDTKKGDTRWIRDVKSLSVITEVLLCLDQIPHRLQHATGLHMHLSPGTAQTQDWRSTESGDDSSQ